ncbi:Esterase EstB [Janthinobacterium sp. KBS0711]|uniref:serine hydrolase domain-containing protein n=1 Tax=Janthinobacterium sp. KBS0711 TaxID=1649647 RepID=UPI000627A92A|nr:serine hydrolase domain-containing protein [Janthinobacterium sp. KBS0711]KKO61929.1 Esterase EstB [Janthinobacterium sp. KBS0711]TSD71943.1 beta-lactamase family protein [Janthinobacterium sp. KBS0711]
MQISNLTEQLTALVEAGVREHIFPGAAWAVGTLDHQVTSAAGRLTPEPSSAAMQVDTLFDIASLTKIISVWSLIGRLVSQKRLGLDSRLADLLPGTASYALAPITVFQLLTHTAGLPLRARLRASYGEVYDDIVRGVLREPLEGIPGQAVEYTDRAALILGLVIERLLGMPLDVALAEHVLQPLGMTATGYGPVAPRHGQLIAPTEFCEQAGAHLCGVVHDFSTRLLGGVCGIAGLFSNVPDLERFLRAMLTPHGDVFDAAWVRESLRVQTGELQPSRGLFWHPAAGTGPQDDVWCHLGFTGTAMWLSPRRGRYAVLLTNKLYYTREFDRINVLRRDFMRCAFDL